MYCLPLHTSLLSFSTRTSSLYTHKQPSNMDANNMKEESKRFANQLISAKALVLSLLCSLCLPLDKLHFSKQNLTLQSRPRFCCRRVLPREFCLGQALTSTAHSQSHASLDTDHVAVRGTRQLKKIFKLSSWVRNQSAQLIDEPQYDSR